MTATQPAPGPLYPALGLDCPACGLPASAWVPSRYVRHGHYDLCLLSPDPASRRPRTDEPDDLGTRGTR